MKSRDQLQVELAKIAARQQRDRQRAYAIERQLRILELGELAGVVGGIKARGQTATLLRLKGSFGVVAIGAGTERVPLDELLPTTNCALHGGTP